MGTFGAGVPDADVILTVTGNTNSFNNLTGLIFNVESGGRPVLSGRARTFPLWESAWENPFLCTLMTLIEDRHPSGTFGLLRTLSYTGTGLAASIAITRTNGIFGNVTVSYATTTNGSTAIANADYHPVVSSTTFAATDTNKNFSVTILSSNSVSSIEKTVNC